MRSTHRIVICLLSVMAAGAVTSPAAAQDPKAKSATDSGDRGPTNPDAKDLASKHYQRGVAFYSEGDYKLALVEFRRAYELTHNHRVLYNIGQVNQQLNNYSKALLALEQYLAEAGDTIPASRRDSVLSDIAQLRTKVAQIEIVVDVGQADVFVDGELMGRSPLPKAVLLDAGDHRIEARREGYRSTAMTVTLATRDNTRVEVRLTEVKAAPLRSEAPSSDRLAPVTTVQSGASPLLWAGWITTGALAAGAGVSAIFALRAANDLSSQRNSPLSTPSERESSQNRAQSFAIATDVLAASALVVGATSLYFTLRGKHSSRQERSTPRLAVGPTSVWLTGEF